MTTKTGSTKMGGVPPGPPLAAPLAGAAAQLGLAGYVWHQHTTARGCLSLPLQCLSHPLSSDPWGGTVAAALALGLLVWLCSLRTLPSHGTSDPSITDQLWSVMPWLYTWRFALSSGLSARPLLMAVLATAWGVRLTANFVLKGGFSGGEDYRWAIVRQWYPGWQFEAVNLVFICVFQQTLLLAFVAPAAAALQAPDVPLGALDGLAAGLFLLLLAGEAVADAQMFAYQTEKYRRRAAGEAMGPYARGFIEEGFWACSRHPNYFCEVSLWWVFYLFGVAATGRWLNWSVLGVVYLTALFLAPQGSLDLTEAISLAKYPAYSDYQRRVNKFIPWIPAGCPDGVKQE